MQQVISCKTTDRLCIEYNQVNLNQELLVYWPVGLVPEITDMSKLRLFLYQSDLLRTPQPDPCNIAGLTPLTSWTPLPIEPKDGAFPLLRATSISIPPSPAILSAIATDNNFFLQIKSTDDKLCSIGPYSIPFPFTSFKIINRSTTFDSENGTSTVSSNESTTASATTTDPVVNSSSSTSSVDANGLRIGLGIGVGLLILVIIIVAWILRKKVKDNEEKRKSEKFQEDMSKITLSLGSDFTLSSHNLIPKDLIVPVTDLQQVVVEDNNIGAQEDES